MWSNELSQRWWGRPRTVRRSRRRESRRRLRLVLEALEPRNLLSGFGESLSDLRSEFLQPVNNPLLAGPPATSGALGTGGSTAANVNTDTEPIAGPHNETSIAVDPTNPKHFIGSANDYQLVPNPDGSVTETIYSRAHVSFDSGQTWTNYAIPFPSQYDATGDPAVAFDADGRAYISTLGFNFNAAIILPDVLVSTSTDGGRSWATPTVLASGSSGPNGFLFNDKPYIAAWGHGNAIVTYTAYNLDSSGNEINQPIYATVTHDGGNSWSKPVEISGADMYGQFAIPVVAKDGSIHVSFLDYSNETGPLYRDQYSVVKVDPITGQALTAPVNAGLVYDGISDYPINIDGSQTYQDSEFRTNPAGNIAADPTSPNHLALVWSDMRNNPSQGGPSPTQLDPYQVKTNADIIVIQSFDGGQTWSSPTAIQLLNDQFMPWAAYDNSGRLQIGFFDRSYDPANHEYGYTLASERSKGQLDFTFQQVTTTLSDPTQGDFHFGVTVNPAFPNAARFLGDYSGIATVPGLRVAALWTDLRNSVTFGTSTGYGQDAYFSLVKAVPANAPQGATFAGGRISATGTAVASANEAVLPVALAQLTPASPLAIGNLPALGPQVGGLFNGPFNDATTAVPMAPGQTSGAEGGGIYSYNSVLTLLASTVKDNKATPASDDIFIGP